MKYFLKKGFSKSETGFTTLGSCNSSINRRQMLNSISKLFRHRRKIMARANSLKKSIKQILQLADKSTTLNSMISQSLTSNQSNPLGDSVRTSINSQSLDTSLTDSDTKKFLVHKIENMDDLPATSNRHLIYDEIDDDDDFEFDKLGIDHIQVFNHIPDRDNHLLLKKNTKTRRMTGKKQKKQC